MINPRENHFQPEYVTILELIFELIISLSALLVMFKK